MSTLIFILFTLDLERNKLKPSKFYVAHEKNKINGSDLLFQFWI